MVRKCLICGSEFESSVSIAKYCGDDCRAKGQNLRRREWEQKTGYLEKKRQKQREKYAKERNIELAEREEVTKKADDEWAKRVAEAEKERFERIAAAAAAGDPLAKMEAENILCGVMSPEYWEAYKDYDVQFANLSGKVSRTTVNGVSVKSNNFGMLVAQSIRETGKIITHAEYLRK